MIHYEELFIYDVRYQSGIESDIFFENIWNGKRRIQQQTNQI